MVLVGTHCNKATWLEFETTVLLSIQASPVRDDEEQLVARVVVAVG